ncbi:hydrolase [Pseudothauera nasutitermitis]|uniref:hydrolase n=1 Tax=Pseudothauera nasutitermitis TaxID=2565930 RepID=UPI001E46E142|nr:hydrolase [Pseudothauera nasutitermitis]
MSTFRTPFWLPGAHAQTLWPLARKGHAPALRRERWDTPDGDFIDLDWLAAPHGADRPLVVLFHGLEGSSRSHYARALLRALDARGWRGVVPHFRGCSGEPNRLARAYHSGDSAEIDWILRRMAPLAGGAPLFAAGVSLGGNALLKWLGERAEEATGLVAGAAAVCPPLDLSISGRALGQGFNRLYSEHFLRTLRGKALAKHARHPGLFDAQRVRRARSLYEFDDVYTGPVHGYAGADDYWRRASSRPWLGGIRVPTLLLNARNDPFVPPAALPQAGELSPAVRFECPRHGGHVGFLHGAFPGRIDWLPARLLQYFDTLSR